MSHDAYKKATAQAETPRDAEYRAFCEATSKLIAISEETQADLKQNGSKRCISIVSSGMRLRSTAKATSMACLLKRGSRLFL